MELSWDLIISALEEQQARTLGFLSHVEKLHFHNFKLSLKLGLRERLWNNAFSGWELEINRSEYLYEYWCKMDHQFHKLLYLLVRTEDSSSSDFI